MTDTVITTEPQQLRVGAVFRRSFELLFGNFLKFFLLSAIGWAPYLLLTSTARIQYRPDTMLATRAVTGSVWIFGLWAFLSLLCQAVVLYGAFEQMRGKNFATGESLKRGLARFFPVVGSAICFAIGVGFATLLLIVPGVILVLMWYVAIPVCVVEKLGPLASLGRSRALTKGNRWRLLGIIAVVGLASWIVRLILVFAVAAMAGVTVMTLFVIVWTVLEQSYSPVLTAVIYHDLRVVHEGIDIERIAAVFD